MGLNIGQEQESMPSETDETAEPRTFILQQRKQHRFRLGNESVLGLDIGSHTIKAVQIERSLRGRSLGLVAAIELSPKGIASEDKLEEIKVAALRKIIRLVDTRYTKIVTSLGGSSVVVRHMKLPLLSKKKLFSSIQWEVRRHVPFKEQTVVDSQILSTDKKNRQMDVLVAAATKEKMDVLIGVLSKADVKPNIVDIDALAVTNSVLGANNMRDGETLVILDIGDGSTTLNTFCNSAPFFSRVISIGGSRFTKGLQGMLQVGYQEAEAIKKGEDPAINPLELIKDIVDGLIEEIRQSLMYNKRQTGRGVFDKIILTGGSASFKGLSPYMAEQLEIPVEVFDPLKKLRVDGQVFPAAQLETFAPQLTLAAGLALRG
jgi:type IV pilus assembly protein PilM